MPFHPCHHLGECKTRPAPGCTCQRDSRHTEKTPCGGFYFAPGEVEVFPPRSSRWRAAVAIAACRVALVAAAWLAPIALGVAAAWVWGGLQ